LKIIVTIQLDHLSYLSGGLSQNNLSQDNYFDFNYLDFATIQIKIIIKIEVTFDR